MEFLIGGAILVFIVLVIFGRKNIARILGVGRAQATKAAKAAEAMDPQAMLQQQIDNAASRLRQAKLGIEKHKAFVNRLKDQVSSNKEEVAKLSARAQYWKEKGDEGKARDAFISLQKAKATLSENETQLSHSNQEYEQLLEQVQHANRDITAAEAEGRRLGAQLEMARARAEVQRVVTDVAPGGLTGELSSDLNRATEAIRRQISEANASAEVTYDLGADARADIEAEEAIEKQQYEDDFRAFMTDATANTSSGA